MFRLTRSFRASHISSPLRPPTRAAARASPVGPPNLPLRPTRPRALLGREIVRVARAGAAQPNGRLGGLVPMRSHVPPHVPRKTSLLPSGRGPMRARRLAPSARASLRAASVRFTPSRASPLSPRRVSLLAGASPAHTPAPAGPLRRATTVQGGPTSGSRRFQRLARSSMPGADLIAVSTDEGLTWRKSPALQGLLKYLSISRAELASGSFGASCRKRSIWRFASAMAPWPALMTPR
jgi:hypothetical protein